jgi:hypothetical protein
MTEADHRPRSCRSKVRLAHRVGQLAEVLAAHRQHVESTKPTSTRSFTVWKSGLRPMNCFQDHRNIDSRESKTLSASSNSMEHTTVSRCLISLLRAQRGDGVFRRCRRLIISACLTSAQRPAMVAARARSVSTLNMGVLCSIIGRRKPPGEPTLRPRVYITQLACVATGLKPVVHFLAKRDHF